MSKKEEVKGSVTDMINWMKENKVDEDKVNKFSASMNESVSSRGMAPNCRRYISGSCGDSDSCLAYTITCCTVDENGVEICGSTTVCRC